MRDSTVPPAPSDHHLVNELEFLARVRVLALVDADLERLIEAAAGSLSVALDGAPVAIHRFHPEDDSLELVSAAVWPDAPTRFDAPCDFGRLRLEGLHDVLDPIGRPAEGSDPTLSWSTLPPDGGMSTDFDWPIEGLTVAIPGRKHPFGALTVRSSASLSTDDLRFVQNLANLLATAVLQRAAEQETRQSRDELAVILESIEDGITAQSASGELMYANSAAARLIGFESAEALLQADLVEVMDRFQLFDESGSPFDLRNLPGRRALAGETPEPVLLRYRIKDSGDERWSLTRAQPVRGPDGQVALAVNIFQDVTELKRRERYHRLLSRAGELLAESLDPKQRVARVAELVVPDVAEWCVVDLLEADGAFRNVALAHRDPEQVAAARAIRERYPPDRPDSAQRQVMATGKPLLVREITPEMIRSSAVDEEHAEALLAARLRSIMIVPLLRRGQALGVISLLNTMSGPAFGPEDLEEAEELARRVALSVDNARLYSETVRLNESLERRVAQRTSQLETMLDRVQAEVAERQRAQAELSETQRRLLDSREDERLRLAQELHDGAIQELYGLAMQLERCLGASANPELRRTGEEMGRTVKAVMAELRRICTDLRPPALTTFGLAPALRSHVDRVASDHPDVAFELALEEDGHRLSDRSRLALYRIAQEAINNALKHAGPDRVHVGLCLSKSEARLSVEDNGTGFDPPERLLDWVRAGHLGLAGVQERAESLGGTVSLNSAPGRGTRLEAQIPFQAEFSSGARNPPG